ncbi:MAG: ABC transporter ATP-binding protein, partial [Planctomycetota bacterium]
MIVAHRLTKSFGRFKAVDSVDFEIPSGAVAGFLGPNGAGKTTTIRMLCGVLRPTAGRAVVDGLDVRTERQEAQRRIGYLPEAVPLYGEMRVREYLEFRGRLFELTRSARRTGVEAAMSKVGLTEVARRPIGQLSRGYRQRVGLAAALVHDPPVLILDEPTVGLDPAQVREVRRLIKDLAGDRTVLLSSHILAEVELICDRIVMLAAGRVRAAG